MPRTKREKSSTGIYHVMLRGINRQEIFEESEDYDKFISVLKDCKELSKCKLGTKSREIKGRFLDLLLSIKEPSSDFRY